MLTRQKLGYAPGTMDAVFLGQDFAALDAELHSEQAKYDDLLLASSEIEAEARRLGLPELLVKALIQRSNILLADQRYLEAIAALTAADQALGNLRQYDLKVSIYAGLAEAQARRQDWQAVSDTCEKGIALVETHRYKVSGQYLQSSYLRSRIGLYARGAQAAYQLKEHQLALQRAELSKCRSVLRYRPSSAAPTEKEHRIQQEFRQVCQQVNAARAAGNNQALDALLTKRRTLWDLLLIQRAQARTDYSFPEFDLAALQAALDDDEAVLYYYWLGSHTLLAALIAHEQFTIELRSITSQDRAALEQFSRGILEYAEPNMPPGFWDYAQARRFADFLLPPAASEHLKTKRRLIISPHRLLHTLPFHALAWDEEHLYLIQRFAVSYTPNMSCLLRRYPAPAQRRLLAMGIRDYQVPGHPLSSLKEAEEEIDDLERLYRERGLEISAWRGVEAGESRMCQLEKTGELGMFTSLHLATHGWNVNSDTPMESHLFLQDSLLEGLEIANWQLDAELVVLSACCSGQRPIGGRGMAESPGDDLFGLPAAFFAAGAKQALSSLWPVYSDTARAIMTAFHRFLIAGQSPELALQGAVVEYINSAGLRLRNSFYWAPFFLVVVGRPYRKQAGP